MSAALHHKLLRLETSILLNLLACKSCWPGPIPTILVLSLTRHLHTRQSVFNLFPHSKQLLPKECWSHLRLLSSTGSCYYTQKQFHRLNLPDHQSSKFSPPIEAAVTHEIALPTSSSTRCSCPTRDLHTRLPANTPTQSRLLFHSKQFLYTKPLTLLNLCVASE
jgi:hypothetical protein